MTREKLKGVDIRAAQIEIEAALRDLPIQDPVPVHNVMPYSSLIPDIARNLSLMRRLDDTKHRRKRALADLEQITNAARELGKQIETQILDSRQRINNLQLPLTAVLSIDGVRQAMEISDQLKKFVAIASNDRNRHVE